MAKYLYLFAYESSEQAGVRGCGEFAEESSAGVFIDAKSREEALEWGQEVSEKFVSWLYGESAMDWESMGFAHWVEENPEVEYPPEVLAKLPTVAAGSFPDFKRLLEK